MAWVAPRTWVAGETLTAALMNEQVRDNWNAAFPVGSLHWRMQAATSTETAIDGFLLEGNGVAVSRATYASLQTKLSGLSYPFGAGNGTTTMNLPDVSGRAPIMMAASGHASVNGLGDSDGVTKASRTPVYAAHAHTGGAHTHGAGSYAALPVTVGRVSGSDNTGGSGSISVTGTSSSGGAVSTDGAGAVAGNYVVVGVLGVKY